MAEGWIVIVVMVIVSGVTWTQVMVWRSSYPIIVRKKAVMMQRENESDKTLSRNPAPFEEKWSLSPRSLISRSSMKAFTSAPVTTTDSAASHHTHHAHATTCPHQQQETKNGADCTQQPLHEGDHAIATHEPMKVPQAKRS